MFFADSFCVAVGVGTAASVGVVVSVGLTVTLGGSGGNNAGGAEASLLCGFDVALVVFVGEGVVGGLGNDVGNVGKDNAGVDLVSFFFSALSSANDNEPGATRQSDQIS